MDNQAKKKAYFRAKLNAQKKDKRIDSPLVRYNESDQPVCRVCNVVLKSESNWEAHQASRKHHEAINNLKANASGLSLGKNVKFETPMGTKTAGVQPAKLETSMKVSRSQTSSGLPPNFFDSEVTAKQKTDSVTSAPERATSVEKVQPSKQIGKGSLPEGFFDGKEDDLVSASAKELRQTSVQNSGSETKQAVKGALPEGFFDNKEADLLAHGIKPVKPSIKEEYKEFEKLIQEDLKVVDTRMEEEEIDAADMIEEEEHIEQRTYKEKVEMLKRKKMELEAARSAKRSKGSEVSGKKPKDEESSSDEDDDDDGDDENFAVDWRAQHL